MTAAAEGLSPYRGLAAFAETDLDARLFFGRDSETEIVAANLQAARLTVLYGASGVGKSSLLRAGVTHHLRSEGRDGSARQVVALCSEWRGDPLAAITSAVAETLVAELGHPVSLLPELSLADRLEQWCGLLGGEIYLILDQLEEYVLYHGERHGGPLADALAEVVTRPNLRVGVLLGVRDDALAELDALKARVPSLFGNVLRLDRLTRGEGRQAILGPLAELERLGGPSVTAEDALVETLLDQVATGMIVPGDGRGVASDLPVNGHIEAPYLQLVMERLWEVERADGSHTLRAATLAALGGAAHVVQRHLERALGELDDDGRDIAAGVFRFLVTPSGTKISHRVSDLARYTGRSESELQPVLDHLEHERVVRRVADDRGGGSGYEIFHDVLADAVLGWSARHESDAALSRERLDARRRHRRLGVLAAVALTALLVMTALTVYAFRQRAEAKEQAELAAAASAETQQAADRVLRSEAERIALTAKVRQLRLDVTREQRRLRELRGAVAGQRVLVERRTAEAFAHATNARANEMLARSAEYTTVDPELSLLLAVEAAELVRSPAAENALRTAIRLSNVREVLPAGGAVTSVAVAGRLQLAAGADGVARLYRASDGTLVRPLEHGAPITAAALDATGRRAVTASVDGSASVWTTGTGRRVVLRAHGERVTAATFQPHGDLVATASLDRTLHLSRAPNGSLAGSYAHSAPIDGVDWTADGSRLLAWGGRQVVLLNRQGDVVRTFAHAAPVASAAISPDGSHVATGDRGRVGVVRIFDAGSATDPPLELVGHQGEIFDLAFSADGALLASGSADGTARVWNVSDGALVRVASGHRNYVTRVAFSADGDWLATAGSDGNARVRPAQGAGDGALLAGHRDRIEDIAWSPDGRRLVTAGADATARVWDAGTATQLLRTGRLTRATLPVSRSTARSPDGRLLARAAGTVVELVDRGGRVRRLAGHRAVVTSVAFSPDGSRLVTASKDHDARVWNVATGRTAHLLIAHFAAVADARFSPDGRWIVTAGPRSAGLWLAESGAFVDYLRGPEPGAVLADAGFGADSRTVVTRERSGVARRWRCDICGTVDELRRLGRLRLERSGRVWTPAERALLR